jgi:hypothetical protein
MEVIAMKQTSLWSGEGDGARATRWKRLPEKVRAELIAQLARLVVKSLIRADDNIQKPKQEKR